MTDLQRYGSDSGGKRAEAQNTLEPVCSEAVQLEANLPSDRLEDRPQVVLHIDFMSESTTQVVSASNNHDVFPEFSYPC